MQLYFNLKCIKNHKETLLMGHKRWELMHQILIYLRMNFPIKKVGDELEAPMLSQMIDISGWDVAPFS